MSATAGRAGAARNFLLRPREIGVRSRYVAPIIRQKCWEVFVRKRSGLVISLGVVLALVVSACGSDAKSSDSTTTSGSGSEVKTVSPGVLTVATNLPAPGFWNGDSPDSITGGYEYAMAQDISKELGLDGKVKVVNVSFDQLVAGQAKGFDVAFSQVTIKPERAEVVDFTEPYFSSDQGVLMQKGKTLTTVAQAKQLQWGVQAATTALDVLDKIKPTKEPRVYQETTQAFAALQAGQVDAVMLDTAIVLEEANQPGSTFDVVAQFPSGEEYGGVLPKGSALLAKVDAAIKKLKADGTLDALAEKWLKPEFGKDPTKVPVIKL